MTRWSKPLLWVWMVSSVVACIDKPGGLRRIGGTISGLTGNGLVLQLNGGHDLTVAANATAFDFTDNGTWMVEGANYSVTVAANSSIVNPPQSCTVENPSGRVGADDVTGVAVTCANTYAISGTVTALKGSGLVLNNSLGNNNAGEDLVVAINGEFVFPTRVAVNSSFAITVKAQPINPEQSCVVANGSGTIAGVDVTNVAVTCHVWGAVQRIENNSVSAASSPQVAMDSAGNAIAVWVQAGGTHSDIMANRYVVGSGWDIAQRIETDDRGNAGSPQVAVDSAGRFVAVWWQYDGTRTNIMTNRYKAENGWGGAQLIGINDTGDAYYPQVAMDPAGNAMAVWQQFDEERWNIWANRYTAGSWWGTAQPIETNNEGDASLPQVAMDSVGNAIAVWHQFDGKRVSIWVNRYATRSEWGDAQLIETNDDDDAYNPQVAMDAMGNAIAVWQQFDGMRYSIMASEYIVGSGWTHAQLIEANDEGDAYTPRVAMDAMGNAMIVWHQSDGKRSNIWANRYTIGSEWGSAQLIENDDTGDAYNSRVAMDSAGNAVAVWQQQFDGMRYSIMASEYIVGSGWTHAQVIETDNSGDAASPQAAMVNHSNAVAVWEQSDGACTHIYANRY